MSRSTLDPLKLETKILDPETGMVEALVAVTGNVDRAGDVLEPGALSWSGRPKVLLNHDPSTVIGKTVEVKELPPGHIELPHDLASRGLGAVKATMQLNLEKQAAREALSDIRFHDDHGWSIGYNTKSREYKGGHRHLTSVDMIEMSAIPISEVAANPEARTLSVKSTQLADLIEQAEAVVAELRSEDSSRDEAPAWARDLSDRLSAIESQLSSALPSAPSAQPADTTDTTSTAGSADTAATSPAAAGPSHPAETPPKGAASGDPVTADSAEGPTAGEPPGEPVTEGSEPSAVPSSDPEDDHSEGGPEGGPSGTPDGSPRSDPESDPEGGGVARSDPPKLVALEDLPDDLADLDVAV